MPTDALSKPIRTTGELRTLLASLLIEVKNGTADLDTARTMVKIAAQVNESFYSEIKVALVNAEAKREVVPLGDLTLGSSAKAES